MNEIILTKKFLKAMDDTPLQVLDLFVGAYVQLNPFNNTNNYGVKNNDVTISWDHSGDNVPLFHEIAHFLLAPVDRLHLSNYGYTDEYYHPTKWHDLDVELRVYAIEQNLLKFYHCELSKGVSPNDATVWNYLTGWNNYKKFYKLNAQQMKKKTSKILLNFKREYDWLWIENEWNRRNTILSRRVAKTGTIIPAILSCDTQKNLKANKKYK